MTLVRGARSRWRTDLSTPQPSSFGIIRSSTMQSGAWLLEGRQGGIAVGRLADDEARALERDAQHGANVGVVVDYEYLGHEGKDRRARRRG